MIAGIVVYDSKQNDRKISGENFTLDVQLAILLANMAIHHQVIDLVRNGFYMMR